MQLFSEYDIMIIMGRRVDMNSVLAWGVRAGWQAQHKKLLSLGPAPSLVGTVPGLRKAGPQDAEKTVWGSWFSVQFPAVRGGNPQIL